MAFGSRGGVCLLLLQALASGVLAVPFEQVRKTCHARARVDEGDGGGVQREKIAPAGG